MQLTSPSVQKRQASSAPESLARPEQPTLEQHKNTLDAYFPTKGPEPKLIQSMIAYPLSPWHWKALLHFALGRMSYESGRYAQAEAQARKAMLELDKLKAKIVPMRYHVLDALAWSCFAQDKEDEAHAFWTRAERHLLR